MDDKIQHTSSWPLFDLKTAKDFEGLFFLKFPLVFYADVTYNSKHFDCQILKPSGKRNAVSPLNKTNRWYQCICVINSNFNLICATAN